MVHSPFGVVVFWVVVGACAISFVLWDKSILILFKKL